MDYIVIFTPFFHLCLDLYVILIFMHDARSFCFYSLIKIQLSTKNLNINIFRYELHKLISRPRGYKLITCYMLMFYVGDQTYIFRHLKLLPLPKKKSGSPLQDFFHIQSKLMDLVGIYINLIIFNDINYSFPRFTIPCSSHNFRFNAGSVKILCFKEVNSKVESPTRKKMEGK